MATRCSTGRGRNRTERAIAWSSRGDTKGRVARRTSPQRRHDPSRLSGGARTLAEETCIRSALFVDFDNVYIGLRGLDTEAAERFAADPGKWLQRMEDGMPGPGGADLADLRDRRVLIRRCYLNPVAFS